MRALKFSENDNFLLDGERERWRNVALHASEESSKTHFILIN
jgi:hypothetical protein